jgi:LmbE family N-acetylglucosaminyl deacetylase
MKAVAMVAHPDDCVIFAYSFIHNHPEYEWTVCYLTYTESHERGQEFTKFWNKRGVAVKFLGYPDEWNFAKNCPGEINEELATFDIQSTIADHDLVLTHNAQGEYGHPHHILVNRATVIHPNRITFASFGTGNVKYSLDPMCYSLDEFPLHRDIVSKFHQDGHINEYTT